MAITIRSPMMSRERIIGFGGEGTGKSSAYLSIARACPDATFHVIDNDNTVVRLLETEFQDVAERGNVIWEPYEAYEWAESIAAIRTALAAMGRDDWLVIDTLGKLWDQVQEWFIAQVFQQDIDDYFLKLRMQKEALKSSGGKEKKSLGAFEGWLDWPVINQVYHKNVSKPLVRCHGHLFIATEAKSLSDEDDKSTRDIYGSLGRKPEGQKRSGHLMQTVLHFSKKRAGTFHLESVVKDRGRENWKGEQFTDFATDYLVNTAGWVRARVEG